MLLDLHKNTFSPFVNINKMEVFVKILGFGTVAYIKKKKYNTPTKHFDIF